MSDKKVLVKYSIYTKGMQPEYVTVWSTIPKAPIDVLKQLVYNSNIDNTDTEINSYIFNISIKEVDEE